MNRRKESEAMRWFNLFLTREFGGFLVVGAISSLVNLACGYALYGTELLPYTLAVFLGAASGLVVNFLLNYFFIFKYKGRGILGQFWTFFLVAGAGTVLTALLARLFLFLFVLMGLHQFNLILCRISAEFTAHAAAVAVVTFYSYLAHKFFSFNVGFRQRLGPALRQLLGKGHDIA